MHLPPSPNLRNHRKPRADPGPPPISSRASRHEVAHLFLGLSLAFRASPSKVRSGMAALIDDDLMIAEFGGRVIATVRYSPHAAAEGQGAWAVSGLPRRCSRGTRRLRRWCSRSGSPLGTATMICSSSAAGARSRACDGPAHADYYSAGGGGGGGCGRGDLVPARVRTGAFARGVGGDGAAGAVHGGRADLGGVHGGTGLQPPGPARTTARSLEPGSRDRGHRRS